MTDDATAGSAIPPCGLMKLTTAQLGEFERDGFVVLPKLFSAHEISLLRARLPSLFDQPSECNIREKHSGAVRSALALHQRDELFAKLARHPRLVEPARQIAASELYIQQVKVNVKEAFGGELFQWHYDFATHHHEDGAPAPRALNLHVFLSEVNEFNGPLYFLPGSHLGGPAPASLDEITTGYPIWVVEHEAVAALANERGMFSATGDAGTALIFGDSLIHGSPANMSPWERPIFSMILNPVDNALTTYRRPEHLHHHDLTPVISLPDSCLIS